MKVTAEFHYDSAHRLPQLPNTHKCHRLHGHTYRLLVTVERPVDEIGFVIDFADMKAAIDPVVKRLDHYYLNEIDGLENPTVEVQLVWLWEQINLPGLAEITLFEGLSNHGTYAGGDSA